MVQSGEAVWLGMEDGVITLVHCSSYEVLGSWSASSTTIGVLFGDFDHIWSGSDDGVISKWFFEVVSIMSSMEL
jgi:hypothetical protein